MLKKFIERPVPFNSDIGITGNTGCAWTDQFAGFAIPGYRTAELCRCRRVTAVPIADVVLKSVIIPLEEQINGVENMTYMTSSAGNDGSAGITINFKVGTNPDLAAVNVQNRVSRAASLLPLVVTEAGVTVSKSQSSQLIIFALYSENKSLRRNLFAELC